VRVVLESDLVICVPYTSPALIAQKYKIPVVYYWPSDDYLLEKEIDGIRVIIGKEDLVTDINNTIGYP
jgi:polysaccharide biosynthesis PFTS motif protein